MQRERLSYNLLAPKSPSRINVEEHLYHCSEGALG